MATLITPWSNEGFFGDVVVLVEGEDDRSAIIGTALQLNMDLESMGVAVIPCDGKGNIDRLYLAFSGLGIPTYIIFDGDVKTKKNQENSAKANRILQRLLGVSQPVNFPPTEITPQYAVFQDTLDTEIRDSVGEPVYGKTALAFMREHGYPDHDSCRKSPLFFNSLLEEAAQNGIKVQVLEDIVKAILALLPGPIQRT